MVESPLPEPDEVAKTRRMKALAGQAISAVGIHVESIRDSLAGQTPLTADQLKDDWLGLIESK